MPPIAFPFSPPILLAETGPGVEDTLLKVLIQLTLILVLSRSAQQNAQLDELIASQQQAGSPGFHLGLTPEQFANQFGPSDADLQQIESWLGVQGFAIDAVARGRQWIEFSGSAGQVESAFHTQMHEFSVDGRKHVANASDIAIPQALAPVVAGVLSLNDFRKPSMRSKTQRVSRMADGSFAPTGQFTTGGGSHHLAAMRTSAPAINEASPLLNWAG